MRSAPVLVSSLCLVLGGAGCAPFANPTYADPNVKEAIAGCEKPTAEMTRVSPHMFPGWDCGGCHKSGGSADELVWSFSGTVFRSAGAACNPGGVSDVKVEILDASDKVVLTLTTTKTGNFFSAEDVPLGSTGTFRARVTDSSGTTAEMKGLQPMTPSCASCHFPGNPSGAPGRIFL